MVGKDTAQFIPQQMLTQYLVRTGYAPLSRLIAQQSHDNSKRMGSEFLGKRMGSEFLGKRMGSEFLGKRMGSEFLGKRMGSEFLGRR